MTIPKVIGTETEFGITIRNQPEFNPALASGLVINSYEGGRAKVQWSFEEESPGRDARGFGFESGGAPDYDAGIVNMVLTNGARLYVDHAHPEYSAPEAADPLTAALYDKAGEWVMAGAVESAARVLRPEEILGIYKNNSDGKGNSYGAHENYLVARALPFGDIVDHLMSFLVTRQIYTGAGKVGSENDRPETAFQITQRADFFEEEVGLETTLKRPIINTRDEPHGDAEKYRRLHVIIGDATLSETQTFLKLGAVALFLAALEDKALPDTLALEDPVTACWQVSHDVDLARPLRLADGGTATALELQFQYLEWLAKYAEHAADDPVTRQLLETWETVLTDLEVEPMRLADRLDWVAKRRLLEGYVGRGVGWDDAKLKAFDLQYHDVSPARSLYRRLVDRGAMRRLFTDAQVEAAALNPPNDTRAYFRGRCVEKFGRSLVAANWDSLVFDTGEDSLTRVPMMEPLRGSRALVEEIIDDAEEAADLLRSLGGQ